MVGHFDWVRLISKSPFIFKRKPVRWFDTHQSSCDGGGRFADPFEGLAGRSFERRYDATLLPESLLQSGV